MTGHPRVPGGTPPGSPPGQASPAASVNQPWPRSRALAAMEAPELLRLWALAGEWQPCHPPGGDTAEHGVPSEGRGWDGVTPRAG